MKNFKFQRIRQFLQMSQCSTVFSMFEKQLLLFTLTLTTIVATTFLVGGVCSLWQWWTSVCLILTVPFFYRQLVIIQRIKSNIIFILFLFLIYLLSGLMVTEAWVDTQRYHLPAIRLMIEGWNPITMPLAKDIAENFQLDPWGMRFWHVFSMPKGPWYFSAASYFFTKMPLNLLFPLFPFLFIPVCCSVCRFLGKKTIFIKGIAIFLLWILLPSPCWSIVDCTVVLAAIGLLATMGEILDGKDKRILSLVAYSFWMMTAKQTALLACFIFWFGFMMIIMWRNRKNIYNVIRDYSYVAIPLIILFMITSASPYFTAWKVYGHPLYPNHSMNEEKAPIYKIVCDFDIRNDDAKSMGHIGHFCNAFISPTLTQAYYRWKYEKDSFAPRVLTWQYGGDDGINSSAPTPFSYRWHILLLVAIILSLGKSTERILVALLFLTCLIVPKEMIGFFRYFPQTDMLFIIALRVGVSLNAAIFQWLITFIIIGISNIPISQLIYKPLTRVDAIYSAKQMLKEKPPKILYTPAVYKSFFLERPEYYYQDPNLLAMLKNVSGDAVHTTTNSIRLLQRQIPALKCSILKENLTNEAEGSSNLVPFLGNDFFINAEECSTRSLFELNAALPNRSERLKNYPKIVLKIIFVRLPILIIQRLCTPFTDVK